MTLHRSNLCQCTRPSVTANHNGEDTSRLCCNQTWYRDHAVANGDLVNHSTNSCAFPVNRPEYDPPKLSGAGARREECSPQSRGSVSRLGSHTRCGWLSRRYLKIRRAPNFWWAESTELGNLREHKNRNSLVVDHFEVFHHLHFGNHQLFCRSEAAAPKPHDMRIPLRTRGCVKESVQKEGRKSPPSDISIMLVV